MRITGDQNSLTTQQASHGGSFAPKMVLGFKKLSPGQQKVVRKAFSKFSKEAVESLWESDHSVLIRKGKPGMCAGLYDSKDKQIIIYADPEGHPEDEHTIIHEMVHALDRVKFKKERGLVTRLITPDRESDHSRHDPELRQLHQDYSTRSLPHFGEKLAEKVNLESGSGEVAYDGRRYNWKNSKNGFEVKGKSPAAFRYLEFAGDAIKKGIACGLGAAFGALIGFGGAPILGAVVAAPLAVFAVQHLRSAAKSISNERSLVGHQDSHVKISTNKMTFQLDQELEESQKMTSSYATVERQPEEYLAESMTQYLRSDKSRKSLKERDPKMHDYCESWKLAP